MKRKTILGILISILFLYLASRKIQFTELGAAFSRAQYLYLIPAACLTLLSFLFRAYRWKFIVKPIKNVGTMSLFSSTMIGFMANNLLPARLGEFVRAYAIGKKEGVSKTSAFATIVVERILDVFVLVALFGFLILTMHLPPELKTAGYLALAMNVVALAGLMALIMFPDRVLAAAKVASRPLPGNLEHRVSRLIVSFGEGLGIFRRGRDIFYTLILSFVIWGLAGIVVYFSILSVGLTLPANASVLLLVVLSLGVMIPSSPAYVGPIQYFSVLGLSLFGVESSRGLAFSILYHSTQFFPVTLVGLFYLWKENLSMKDLTAKEVTSLGQTPEAGS